MLCVQYTEAENPHELFTVHNLECALKAFFLTLWITCISCKYSFIDFINFFLSCFVSLFRINKHRAPFLSFLLDICESWSLAEGEEQSSHHEATPARSVHRSWKCWVPCVRSADAAKWKAVEEIIFFFFPFSFLQDTKYVQDCRGGNGTNSQIANCHLIWQLECRFNVWGRGHLSAKRLIFKLNHCATAELCHSAPGTADWLKSVHVAVHLNLVSVRSTDQWMGFCLNCS